MEAAPLRTSEQQVLAGSCIAQVLGVPPGDEVCTRLARLVAAGGAILVYLQVPGLAPDTHLWAVTGCYGPVHFLFHYSL